MTVDPAILNIITAALAGTVSKTYDGTLTATLAPDNFLLSGFVNGDSASVTKTTGSYAGKNIGSNILVSTSLAGSDFSPAGYTYLSNYTLPTSASGNIGTITAAGLTVTGAAAQNKVYDATAAATIAGANLSGVLLTDSVTLGNAASGTFANKNVGTSKAVTTAMTISGGDAGNYTLTQPLGLAANITARGLNVTATGVNKVYDGLTGHDRHPGGQPRTGRHPHHRL